MRRLLFVVFIAAVLAPSASASQLIDRNATGIRLKVSQGGKAMLSYRARGRHWDVLAWGAINAFHPGKARKQVQFRLDRAGGWGAFGKKLRFRNACLPYDGPTLVHVVTACKAPDGSYWAVQKWRRTQPNLGFTPWRGDQRVWALHLSHWKGPMAVLEGYADWSWNGRFHHVFGRLTYLGRPVHGYRTTRYGARLDKYGRAGLPGHVRLRVRGRVATRELVRDAQGDRRLLLHVPRPQPAQGWLCAPAWLPRRAPRPGQRRGVPDDRRRARA